MHYIHKLLSKLFKTWNIKTYHLHRMLTVIINQQTVMNDGNKYSTTVLIYKLFVQYNYNG